MCSADTKAKLTAAFNQVDTDKSGWIDVKEVENVLTNYYKSAGKTCDPAKCKKEAGDFMKDVDQNKDSKITLDEFLKYFSQFCK